VQIVEIAAGDTHSLRRSVLRDGTTSDQVTFDGDDESTTFHLGVLDGGSLVAISTWMARRYPDLPALTGYQLRGMAIDTAHRSGGIGSLLLVAGLDRCRSQAAEVIWARARMSALGFYERHGFETRGPEYTDLTTGLPHIDIVRQLA
jgi:predicted GNAT family N-acyltransferase